MNCSIFQNIFTVNSAPLRISSAAYHQSTFLKPSSRHNASRSRGKRRSARHLSIGDAGFQRYGWHGTDKIGRSHTSTPALNGQGVELSESSALRRLVAASRSSVYRLSKPRCLLSGERTGEELLTPFAVTATAERYGWLVPLSRTC